MVNNIFTCSLLERNSTRIGDARGTASTVDARRVVNIPQDIRRDTESETCTPLSFEYERRVKELACNEDFQRAVRAEIERSSCKNAAYSSVFRRFNRCIVVDEREEVNVTCSTNCSKLQHYYVYCDSLKEEILQLNKECGVDDTTFCLYDDSTEQFCIFKDTYSYLEIIYEECIAGQENDTDRFCGDSCRKTLKELRDFTACCLATYREDPEIPNALGSGSGAGAERETLFELYSLCGLEIPEPCSDIEDLSADDVLACARDSDDTSAGEDGSDSTGTSGGTTVVSSLIAIVFTMATFMLN